MPYSIRKAVVIGAGTMGAAIAAHLANAGVSVALLDMVAERLTPEESQRGLTLDAPDVRDRLARQGLERALKSRPASFFTPEHAARVTIGNLEDDFSVVAEADWVIEAVVENLEIKRRLMQRIDAVRPPQAIVSTNTSGIPVAEIAAGLSDGFRRHFLGTHFFNPPRYLKLLELIPTAETLPVVTEAIGRFCELRLGKGVVVCKDTPNFIANRLAFGSGAFALDFILAEGYSVEEVDALTGPLIGRPKTATFRLIDLVGVDVWEHVGRNLAPAIPQDAQALRYLASERANTLIHQMVEQGRLGGKSKQGFYKEVRLPDGTKEFWVLDLKTLEYAAPRKARFDSVGKAKDLETLPERLKALLAAEDRAGLLVRAILFQGFAYASERIPEIADTPLPIDQAMCWGFGHESGPFETWDALGVAETARAMVQAGFPAAPWVTEMLAKGCATFYKVDGQRKTGVYNPARGAYEAIDFPGAPIPLKDQPVLRRNAGATLRDVGDGVACLELHTKLNTLDDDIFNQALEALDLVEADFEGLILSTDAENFSAGANLAMVLMAAQSGAWEILEGAVLKLQGLNQRMRYFSKPVVVAPAGLALGGGAEILMHASRVVAHVELYAGLVEVGAGVIPAGGGTKEMLRRLLNPPLRTENAQALPYLQRIFEQVGMARVSTSAEEALHMGLLGPADCLVMNRDHLLMQAKAEVLHLASAAYHPPLPESIYAAGRDALAALRVGIFQFRQAGQITPYEAHIAEKLAFVMTGGEISRPAWVSEQYILDLEREAFLSLCGEEKTRQRMWSILQTGKPVRN